MALPPLAQVSDLAAWVGQTIESDDPRAGAVLSASTALVRAYAGETWMNGDALGDVPGDVVAVVVQAAARVWANPDGLTSFTIDDSTRRWGESARDGLYLTASEKEILSAYRTSASATGLGTIGVTRGDLGYDTVYVPTGPPPSGYPFPWYDAEESG